MSNKLTNEQRDVIKEFGKNMLVSASAGSGKTKVLIAKITKILLDEMAKVKDLLVVTFTNAACNEIKERLQKSLIESKNQKLFDQIDDLSVCDILTFDAFCKKVVDEFGYQIAVDGGFSIADGNMSMFLKNKALDNLISTATEQEDKKFFKLMDLFFDKRNDKKFREAIISIHNFVVNHKSFDEYEKILNQTYSKNLNDSTATKFSNQLFLTYKQNFENQLNQLILSCEMLKEDKLADNLSIAKQNLSVFKDNYVENLKNYYKLAYPTISSNSKKDTAEVLRIKEKYKASKALFKENAEKIFPSDVKDFDDTALYEYLQDDKEVLQTLLDFTKKFDEEYQKLKKSFNALDFVDLEKFALEILQADSVAKALREKYKFIFIDEYQDTSKLQNDIIDLIARENNLVIVGDVKQSIYRYRNAEPQIFLDKYSEYKSQNKFLYELNKNFRSEKKILDFTNFVFDLVMQQDIDGIDYKTKADLQYGEIVKTAKDENFVDVVLIDNKRAEKEPEDFEFYSVKDAPLVLDDYGKIDKEALIVAQKIADYVKNKKYWNVDKESFEPITYGDIAILTRDQKNIILNVRKVLNNCGIPVKCKFDENIADNFDVELLFSILRLIENSQDDNSLLIVMSSIVGKFSFDEICEIRQFDETQLFFYQAVKNYADKNQNQIAQKICDLYKKIGNYQIALQSKDICEFIMYIVQNEELDKYFWLNGYGKQFDEHLRLLISSYQSIKDYSLNEFISYIDTFAKEEVSTQIVDSENAVTISTIHASKGLEYPVVFILQSGKKFSLRPESILCDTDFGLSKKSINFDTRTKFDNPISLAIESKMIEEQKKDEKRLLYVALTRAKNYLTVVGTKNVDNITPIENGFDVRFANSYLDYVCGGLSQTGIDHLVEKQNLIKTFDDMKIHFQVVDPNTIDKNFEQTADKKDFKNFDSNNFAEIVNKKFFHSSLSKKNSVSQIMEKEEHYNISNFSAYNSDQKQEEDFLAIGTLYHLCMENLDFFANKSAENQIDELLAKGVLNQSDFQVVDKQKVITAFNSIKQLIEDGDVVD